MENKTSIQDYQVPAQYFGAFPTEVRTNLAKAFHHYDTNGDKTMDEKEFKSVLHDMGFRDIGDEQVKEMLKEQDQNNDGVISWLEFLEMMKKVAGKDPAYFTQVIETKAGTAIMQEQGTSQRVYLVEERRTYTNFINYLLKDIEILTSRGLVPISTDNEEIFDRVENGLIYLYLLHAADPDAVDMRSVCTKDHMNMFQVNANNKLFVATAKAMGMPMAGITGQDVKGKNTGKHLQIMKQIMKTLSSRSINIKDVPEIFRLLKEGEEVHDLKKMSADELLVRWINYHLSKLGKDDEKVSNLGKDIKNSRALIHVMTRLDSSLTTEALAIEDEVERAQKMIDNSKQMGVPHILEGKDFCLANVDLNRIFVSLLFNTKHGLEELNEEEIKKATMIDDDVEGAADERAFRLWMNSLNINDLYITDLYDDVSDGLALLRIIDKLKPETVNWKKVEMKPKNIFQKGANCNLVVEYLKVLNINMAGLQGSQIKDKSRKHVAALVWQLVKYHYLHLIGDKTEDFLIEWANKMTDGKHSPIKDFKDKTNLQSGQYLIHLCSAVEPRIVDWDVVVQEDNEEANKNNAKYALSIARSLECIIFNVWEDLLRPNPKAIMIYITVIYQKHEEIQAAKSS